MNRINIETYENEKKANYKIYIDDKLELEVKGFKYNNTEELMDWITRSYEQYTTSLQTKKTINMRGAKFAGYYEIAQAIELIPVNEQFITKDITRNIISETSSKFQQTNANISAVLSAFKKSQYPSWIKVIGMKGRSRLYQKTQKITSKQIEKDIRGAGRLNTK